MTNRDEVARRVAERLGISINFATAGYTGSIRRKLWDALIASEMRVEALTTDFKDAVNEVATNFKRAEKAEARVKELEAKFKEADERHGRFMVEGGPVVMATEYDKLRQRVAELEGALPSNPHGWRTICMCCGCAPHDKTCDFDCMCHKAALSAKEKI